MKQLFMLSKSFFNRSFLRIVVAGLFLVFFIYFIRNEHVDITQIKSMLSKASPFWIGLGILITFVYLALQATLYIYAFKSIGVAIAFKSAFTLFIYIKPIKSNKSSNYENRGFCIPIRPGLNDVLYIKIKISYFRLSWNYLFCNQHIKLSLKNYI